jgi:hypothetical protein
MHCANNTISSMMTWDMRFNLINICTELLKLWDHLIIMLLYSTRYLLSLFEMLSPPTKLYHFISLFTFVNFESPKFLQRSLVRSLSWFMYYVEVWTDVGSFYSSNLYTKLTEYSINKINIILFYFDVLHPLPESFLSS